MSPEPMSPGPEFEPDAASDAKTRRCWRCLKQFPVDPDLPIGHPAEWWVCDPCHTSLLGRKVDGARR